MKLVRPNRRTLGTIIFMGISDTLGYLSFDVGIRIASNNLPIVATLSGLVGTFTILYASAFYKERLSPLQWAGVVAITAGVLIVLFLGRNSPSKKLDPSFDRDPFTLMPRI